MQIYNTNSTNGALKNTKTTWREAMGFTPWMYDLPDAQYSTAWKSLTDADRFAAPAGPTTLERWTDFTPDASGNVTISAPAAGSYPVRVDGVTSTVAMKAGDNTLSYPGATKVQSNPYFDYQAIPAAPNRDDNNCCHWNGPSWPYATSMELTGLANLLHDYPAQNDISAADYRNLLEQFATLQHKDGKPYIAEAADGDTGNWIYDGEDFSENYNHSSFNDLVLTGLLGIRPQAGDTLVLDPIVDPVVELLRGRGRALPRPPADDHLGPRRQPLRPRRGPAGAARRHPHLQRRDAREGDDRRRRAQDPRRRPRS